MRAHTSALCDKSHLVFCVGFPRSRWRAFSQPCRCASTGARPQDTLPKTSPPHPSPRTPRRAAVGWWCPDAPTPPATAGAHPATSPATPTGATPEGSHTQPSSTRCRAPHATCSAWRPRAIPHYGRAHSTAWSGSHALSAVDPASSPVTPPSAVPVHSQRRPQTPIQPAIVTAHHRPPSPRHQNPGQATRCRACQFGQAIARSDRTTPTSRSKGAAMASGIRRTARGDARLAFGGATGQARRPFSSPPTAWVIRPNARWCTGALSHGAESHRTGGRRGYSQSVPALMHTPPPPVPVRAGIPRWEIRPPGTDLRSGGNWSGSVNPMPARLLRCPRPSGGPDAQVAPVWAGADVPQ